MEGNLCSIVLYDIFSFFFNRIPEGSLLGKLLRLGVKLSLVGIISLACFKVYKWTIPMIT